LYFGKEKRFYSNVTGKMLDFSMAREAGVAAN
jgi:hypothetical protein